MRRSLQLFPVLIAITLALMLACGACKAKPEPVAEKPAPTSSLTIFALQHIRSSGFEAVVLKDFADKNNTALKVVVFPDLVSLLDSLSVSDSLANADIVLGLDSAFALSDSILKPFAPLPEISLIEVCLDIPRDPGQRLIPYATANLSFICDTRKYPDPPKSFGELQDARYYNQMGLCDPSTSGLGRSSLLWTVALFGERGYDQLWNSFRKNVRHLYRDHGEALNALRKGDCGLIIGYNSVPAWISEFHPSESHIQAVIPQEGSFRHTECAALCAGAPNHTTALLFLRHLISAEAQQFVMFKLAMLPVNGRTPLPRGFSRLPWSVYSVNSRLDRYEPNQNLPLWLESWNRLIKTLPGL
ncbi:MAG TPA: thiamine ABC transporter substrate-binding protein [Candidatus Syntrophosphaera sp.]|nr:thiamine ABC transporter substrate-binding protein [Candidatus Syntrophosphaera sp.]